MKIALLIVLVFVAGCGDPAAELTTESVLPQPQHGPAIRPFDNLTSKSKSTDFSISGKINPSSS